MIDSDGDWINGLWIVKENKRVYPHGQLLGHVMGDVNVDSDGLEGVELWHNERLRGRVISVSAIKDALGRPTFIDAEAAKNVQDGLPVKLTIDASLQFEVEQLLKNAVQKTGSHSGSIIIMNSMDGEILAMANQPSFNPNDKTVSADRRRNRAVTDGYEPGSTLKSVILAGALSNGSKLSDSVWAEKGSFVIQGKRISEAESHEKFDWLTLKRMIQVSSNVGAAKLALKLGADKVIATLRIFGFGTKTGMGFPGEISGHVPPKKSFQPLTLANVGFGQGVLSTSIQMTRSYAVFSNGGWLVQPTLLKEPTLKAKESPRKILSTKVTEQVLDALEGVVEEGGTGVKAAVPGYRILGKTGTAQKIDPATGKYSHNKYLATFIGFARDVNPKIVIFVSLDEPHGLYYAADTTAPLFKDVFKAVANRFSIPARPDPVARLAGIDHLRTIQSSLAPLKAPNQEPLLSHFLIWQGQTTDGRSIWKMPPLHSLSAREALRALKGHAFKLDLQGAGVVKSQYPDEGKSIAEGEMIRLILSEPQ